jgi:hypothetical protein
VSVLPVGVVLRDGQLLRQAAQRARAVDPELVGTVRVQSLHGVLDLRHHRWRRQGSSEEGPD